MSGRVVHFEVPYDDAERARGFYADVFGWHVQSIPELGYDIVSTGPVDQGMPTEPGYVGGACPSAVSPEPAGDHDRSRRHRRDAREGARERRRQVGEKIVVAEMGIAAYFEDSEGNLTGLWQNAS